MGPFISEQSPSDACSDRPDGFDPYVGGSSHALPLSVLSQYIGRKKAAIVEMSAIVAALMYGFFFVRTLS